MLSSERETTVACWEEGKEARRGGGGRREGGGPETLRGAEGVSGQEAYLQQHLLEDWGLTPAEAARFLVRSNPDRHWVEKGDGGAPQGLWFE